MTRSILNWAGAAGILTLSALLSACGTSSGGFIKMHPTYSIAAGNVVRIEKMYTNDLQPLSDGRAVTVSREGCRVTLAFDQDRSKVFRCRVGTIIVHGKKSDYLLFPNDNVEDRDREQEQAPMDEDSWDDLDDAN